MANAKDNPLKVKDNRKNVNVIFMLLAEITFLLIKLNINITTNILKNRDVNILFSKKKINELMKENFVRRK